MRRLALLLAVLTLATPAGAQQRIVAAPPAEAGLRGAVSVPAREPLPDLEVRPLSLSQAPVRDGAQCRMSCAQSYYFCLADGDAMDCADSWSRCTVRCGSDGV